MLSLSMCPTIAILWTKEVEIAKSVADLMTSQSIERRVIPDFEMLDAKRASALKRIITNQCFRRKMNMEEQHAQTYDRFSSRKTDCLCDLRAFSSYWRS